MSKKKFDYETWSRKLLFDFCRDYDAKLAKEQVDKHNKHDTIRESRQGKVQADVKLDSAILSTECRVARLNRES
jgi:hypothetical protein